MIFDRADLCTQRARLCLFAHLKTRLAKERLGNLCSHAFVHFCMHCLVRWPDTGYWILDTATTSHPWAAASRRAGWRGVQGSPCGALVSTPHPVWPRVLVAWDVSGVLSTAVVLLAPHTRPGHPHFLSSLLHDEPVWWSPQVLAERGLLVGSSV